VASWAIDEKKAMGSSGAAAGPAVRTICRQPSGELGVVDEFLAGLAIAQRLARDCRLSEMR
jgi:hypothetical protein